MKKHLDALLFVISLLERSGMIDDEVARQAREHIEAISQHLAVAQTNLDNATKLSNQRIGDLEQEVRVVRVHYGELEQKFETIQATDTSALEFWRKLNPGAWKPFLAEPDRLQLMKELLWALDSTEKQKNDLAAESIAMKQERNHANRLAMDATERFDLLEKAVDAFVRIEVSDVKTVGLWFLAKALAERALKHRNLYLADQVIFRHADTIVGPYWECIECGVWHRRHDDSKHSGRCSHVDLNQLNEDD